MQIAACQAGDNSTMYTSMGIILLLQLHANTVTASAIVNIIVSKTVYIAANLTICCAIEIRS